MRKLILPSVLCALAVFSNNALAQILKLTPLTTFGTNGDGSLRPGDVDFLDNGGQLQRGLAWNPVTGHVLVACRTNAASAIVRILVLDGATGTNISQLDMGSLADGGNKAFPINLIGVADDGGIYVANLSNAQIPAQLRLYRWDNEAASQTLVWYSELNPSFSDSVNRRWGDTLAVRGAGTNTQVLLASRGTNVCLFRPVDATMASFYDTTITTTTPVGALGFGLTFGTGNTFWGTAGANANGPLYYLSFDLNTATATTLQAWYTTNVAASLTPITFVPGSNWLVGIDTRPGPDFVRVYSVTNPAFAPVNQDRATWVTNFNNNNFAGAVAVTTNNILYALDGDNGIMAFTLSQTNSNPLPPSITLQPLGRIAQVGSNVLFAAAADGDTPRSYQWYYNTNSSVTNAIPGATNISLTVSNAQITNSGNYVFVATNILGAATSSVASLTVLSNSVDFLAYDGFGYAVGSLLAGQTPPGQLYPWTNNNSSTSGAISNGNLTVAGLSPTTGNSYSWGNSSSSMRLPIGTNVSGTLYFAFAFRLDSLGTAPASPSETMAGFTFGGGTAFASKINVSTNSGGTYQLGLYKAGGLTFGSVASNIFNPGDTVFIISRYTFNSGANNDDTCDLWLNPDPSTFGADAPPTPTIANVGSTGGTDLAQLDRFFFRRSNGFPLRTTADELRIGYTWAQVTPQAPPTLTVVQSGTNVVLSWAGFYGGDYILQGNSNVVGGFWASVTNPVVPSGGNNTVIVPARGTARYFRLLK